MTEPTGKVLAIGIVGGAGAGVEAAATGTSVTLLGARLVRLQHLYTPQPQQQVIQSPRITPTTSPILTVVSISS